MYAVASSATANPMTVQVATSNANVLVFFGATASIVLIGLLITKELLRAYAAEPHVTGTLRQDAVDRVCAASDVAIIPMATVFGLAVLVKILEFL